MLVFDEPTGNLDIQNEQLIFDIAKRIAREKHITILIAIHNLNFALEFGDKFFLMKDGVVKYEGGAETVNENTLCDIFGVKAKIIEANGRKAVVYGG